MLAREGATARGDALLGEPLLPLWWPFRKLKRAVSWFNESSMLIAVTGIKCLFFINFHFANNLDLMLSYLYLGFTSYSEGHNG